MKKLLSLFAAVCCTVFVMATALSDGVKITIAGTELTQEMADNPSGIINSDISAIADNTGYLLYDVTTHTLTFASPDKSSGAQITGQVVIDGSACSDPVTIKVLGENNQIYFTGSGSSLHYKGGKGLIIEGDTDASMYIYAQGSAMCDVLCAVDESATLESDFFPFTARGGMFLQLYTNNTANYPCLGAHHMVLDHLFFMFQAYTGSDVAYTFSSGEDQYPGTMLMQCYPTDKSMFRGYAYNETYPVYVNGFQLCDGKTDISASEMYSVGGSLSYDPEARVITMTNFSIDAWTGDAALLINDKVNPEPITVTLQQYSMKSTLKSSEDYVHGIWAKSPVIIDPNGSELDINATKNAVGLAIDNTTVSIRSLRGGLVDISGNNFGILGDGTNAHLTVDATNMNVFGKMSALMANFSLSLTDMDYDHTSYNWDDVNKGLWDMGTSAPAVDKTVKFTAMKTFAQASVFPAEAGEVVIKQGGKDGTPVSNPYKFGDAEKMGFEVVPATGYEFAFWYDDSSESNPREKTGTAGTPLDYEAWMSRTVETEAQWYLCEGKEIKPYAAKFRGAFGAKVVDIPSPASNTVEKVVFAEGALYYVDMNSSFEYGLFVAPDLDLSAGTIGTPQELMAYSNNYTFYALTYNTVDEMLYAVVYSNSDSEYQLLKISKTGTPDKVGVIEGISYFVALAADGNGDLYLLTYDSYTQNTLYKLSTTDASLTKVGGFGTNKYLVYDHSNAAMMFDPTTDELILQAQQSGGSYVYRINPTTGKAELVTLQPTSHACMGIFTPEEAGTRYTVTVKSQDESKGTVTPSGTKKYKEGSALVMSAKPKKGFMFVNWEEDGSTDNPHTITVTEDATYTAIFDVDPNMVIYPVKIGGVELYTGATAITYPNTDFPALKAGSVVYDPETNTLSLYNAEIEATGADLALELGGELAKNKELTILVYGDSKLKAAANAINVSDFKSVAFKEGESGATLLVKSAANGIYTEKTDLHIYGLKTMVLASNMGISSTADPEAYLYVTGAPLEVQGTNGSICYLLGLEPEYCALPSGYTFDDEDHRVEKGGAVATDNIVFSVWPKVSAVPVEKETGHFTLVSENTGNSFEDMGWFENGDKVTITANPEDGFQFARWMDNTTWKDEGEGKRWPEERPTAHTVSGDKEFKALFYKSVESGVAWYGINNNKVVSFDFSNNAEEVVSPKEVFGVTGVKSGDFVNGEWYLADGTNLRAWEFSGGFDKDTEYETTAPEKKAAVESGITDMAYDLLGGDVYGVKGADLYKLGESKFDKIAAFKYKYKENPEVEIKVTCIAIDGNSTIYVLGQGAEGRLYTVESIDEDAKKAYLQHVGDQEDANAGKIGVAVSADAQSMAFDHSTGELIWGAPDYVRAISTEDGKALIAGDLNKKEGAQGVIKAMHRMSTTVTVTAKVAEDCEDMGKVSVGSSKAGKKASYTYVEGATATITAIAEDGYHFEIWKMLQGKNEKDLKKDGDKASLNVSAGNTTYVAYFAEGAGIESITFDPVKSTQKILINGVLYIMRDGKIYTTTGQLMK